jgi:zinc-ribbon domain
MEDVMPQTCPQCQSEAAEDAKFCPSCGATLSAGATATQEAPPVSTQAPAAAAPASAAPGASSLPAYKFDAARWSLADRIAGVATVVLFISLFLSWFGISVIGITVTASGVSAHGYLYIVMILSILIVAYLVLRAGWEELPGGINLPHLTTMMTATLVNLVIVFIAFIFKPGGSGVGWEFGAFLALIAAVVAAAPYAVPQLRAKTMG